MKKRKKIVVQEAYWVRGADAILQSLFNACWRESPPQTVYDVSDCIRSVSLMWHTHALGASEIKMLDHIAGSNRGFAQDGIPNMDVSIFPCQEHKDCETVQVDVYFSEKDWKAIKKSAPR